MPPSPPSILSLGEVLWDSFPDGPRFGGAPANFACHAAALGAQVTMASAVGDDEQGREAVAILEKQGVDTTAIQTVSNAPTGAVTVILDDQGKPSYTIETDAAWDCIAWTSELESAVEKSDAVYFGTLGQRGDRSRQTIRRALETARSAGIPRVLDINLRAPFFDPDLIRESVSLASFLKLSDEELNAVAEACGIPHADDPLIALTALRDLHALDLTVMTRGADGALLVSPSETIDQPGVPTTVRDTVGAGDSFTAALVTGLLRGDPLADMAAAACQLAAFVCSQPGAVPERPNANAMRS